MEALLATATAVNENQMLSTGSPSSRMTSELTAKEPRRTSAGSEPPSELRAGTRARCRPHAPGSSTSRAPGMPAASSRPPSTLINVSFVRWMTRVGILMGGRIPEMSISQFMRMSAMAADGLAPSRSNLPHHCFSAASSAFEGAGPSLFCRR